MIKSIKLEIYKLRHKHLVIMMTLTIFVQIFWAYVSVAMSMSRNTNVGWKDIIMTIASMNGLFMPIINAVVVSRICDMEHKGNTWKLLLSMSVKYSNIYAAKYICAFILVFYGGLLQVLSIIVFGVLNSFENPIPIFLILKFFIGCVLTSLAIIALQQWISIVIKNQAFALCVGMVGGFIGMTAGLFPSVIRKIFIWSYYTELCPITYNYVNNSVAFVTQDIKAKLVFIVILIGLIFYVSGNIFASKQEI